MGRSLPLILSAALTGCAATHAVTREAAQALISPEEEQQLGRQVEKEVAAQARPVGDRAIQDYVAALGERVAAPSAAVRALPVRFVVLNAPSEVNAFAIPGGTIYVMSGLLLQAQNEAEVAGVLAHEVGHVTERHVAQGLVARYGLSALAAAALGSNPGVAAQIGASVVESGLLIAYTRDQEREADRDAVAALGATRISALPLAAFFRRLAANDKTPSFLGFLQTHPAPGERAEEVERQAAAIGANRGEIGEASYAAVRQRLERHYAARGAR